MDVTKKEVGPAGQRWRGGLPPAAKKAFLALYQIRQYEKAGARVRVAQIPVDGPIMVDPVDASEHPDAWDCVRMQPPPPAYDFYRRVQVTLHRDAGRLGWRWQRNQFRGRPAYVVGNGPSATAAREVIPRRGSRDGVVFAINSAADLFPGDHDFWCLADALWPNENPEWQASLLEEWAKHDHLGAWGLFHAYANVAAVSGFLNQGGVSADFYVGYNENPYRALAGVELPSFCTGVQGLVEVVHAAYWLGCAPIVLFGIDQGKKIKGPLHATGEVGWRTGSEGDENDWMRHPGLHGEVETCQALLFAARLLAAEAAFLQDAEVPVFNASGGIDLLFALTLDPAEAIWLCEESDGVSLSEVAKRTQSLGRRARW